MTPAPALLLAERGDGDVGAPDLERPDGLERLGLEVVAVPRWPERDERRPDGHPAEGLGGRVDSLDADEGGFAAPGRPRPAPRSPRSPPGQPRPWAMSRAHSMQCSAHGSASSRSGAIVLAAARGSARRCPRRAGRGQPRRGPAAAGLGRGGRGRVAARRPGSPPRPAIRTSSGPAPGWSTRARRAGVPALRRARSRASACGWAVVPASIGRWYAAAAGAGSCRGLAIYSPGVPMPGPRRSPRHGDRSRLRHGGRDLDDPAGPDLRARRQDVLLLQPWLPPRLRGGPGEVPGPRLRPSM